MGEYSSKEIEIIDKLVDTINVEIFTIEENERAKSRLDYYLCSDFEKKQVVSKKKAKKYKKKIDNCNPEIASLLIEFAKPIPTNMGIDEFRDDLTKRFIRNEYQELIEFLAMQEIDLFEDHTLEYIILSYGFSYDLIRDYIESVCDIYFYQLYNEFLELPTDDVDVNQIIDPGKKNTDIIDSNSYNENLTNDPLFNSENKYTILKDKFKEEYNIRTAHLNDANDLFEHDFDIKFQDWEEKQRDEINNTFLKIIKELNHDKTFFFGCSFDNYLFNYKRRLKAFLENYTDTIEYDFIEDELKFLENILYDIQNSEAAHDGYPQSGYDEFSKAYNFVSITGYKQYFFSHNKKENFLNQRKGELKLEKNLKESVAFDNHQNEGNNQNNIKEFKNITPPIFIEPKDKKPSEKWYALLYLLELKATNTKPPTNYEGDFIRAEIQEIGKQRTGSTGQSFYRECLKINDIINNNNLLERSFGKDWKQKIINISNNNEIIISHLDNHI